MRRAYRHLQPRSLRAQLALLLLGAAGVALLAFLGLAGVLSSPSHDLMDKLDAWGLDLALALTAAVCVIVAVLASALFARHIRRVFGHLTTAAIRRGGLGGAAASGEPSDIVDPDPHEAEFEDAYQNVAGAIDDLAGRLQLLAGHVAPSARDRLTMSSCSPTRSRRPTATSASGSWQTRSRASSRPMPPRSSCLRAMRRTERPSSSRPT